MSNITPFTQALEHPNQPQAAFEALTQLADQTIGIKLFTLTTINPAEDLARRIYSNMPDAYPVSGTKPMVEDDWSRHVLGARKIFTANTIEGIAKVFFDHELIQSLGCESVLNMPITVNDEVVGTVNCLHEAGFYIDEKVQAAEVLRLPAAACFMLQKSLV